MYERGSLSPAGGLVGMRVDGAKECGRFLRIFARFCLPSAGTFPQRVEMEKLLGIPMVKQEQQPVPDQSVN